MRIGTNMEIFLPSRLLNWYLGGNIQQIVGILYVMSAYSIY